MKWQLPIPELGIEGKLNKEDLDYKLSAIPEDLKDKSVLDLASFDGYYSFVCAQRGASPVVAIDNCLGEEIAFGPDKGVIKKEGNSFPNPKEHELAVLRTYKKFSILNKDLDNPIHFIPMDIVDLDKIKMKFDIVLCFGLYYHVKDIYGLFENCYNLCNDMVIIEGHALLLEDKPFIYINNILELHNDCTNFWSPSVNGLIKLLLRIGFKGFKIVGARGSRILLIAYKEKQKSELSTTENK